MSDPGLPLPGVKVRIARVPDAARIAEIHVRAWQVAYRGIMSPGLLDGLSIAKRRAFWEERLASANATVLVAEAEADVIGWIVYGQSRDDDAASGVVEVYGIYVDPDAWRSGVGDLLWKEARGRLAASAVEEVTLWVLAANSRARAFYEAMGFTHESSAIKHFDRDAAPLVEVRYRLRL